jgi:hypothetical protein
MEVFQCALPLAATESVTLFHEVVIYIFSAGDDQPHSVTSACCCSTILSENMAGSLISPRQKAEMNKEADNNMAGSRVVLFMKIFFWKR